MVQTSSLPSQILQLRRKSRQIVREASQSPEPTEDSPFLRLSWDLVTGPSELPDWFEENRVQGHTRLVINNADWGFDTTAFLHAAAKFKELGAGTYVRHVKTCFHNPWWPTAVPSDPNGDPRWNGFIERCENAEHGLDIPLPEDRNIVREMVKEANGEGLHLIAYYWHMSDRLFAGDDSPPLICKNTDCSTSMDVPRGDVWLDISEPEYREVVLRRLLELAKLGVDGFYFDHLHLPREGCWCSALAKAFEDATGHPAPTNTDFGNPLYRKFLDFKAYKIEETFAYWKRKVKRRFPKVVFVISAAGLPVPHNRFETTNLARVADSTKN